MKIWRLVEDKLKKKHPPPPPSREELERKLTVALEQEDLAVLRRAYQAEGSREWRQEDFWATSARNQVKKLRQQLREHDGDRD